MPAIPLYIETEHEAVAALLDRPTSADAAPVLICAPWGWDESASYRSRRTWTERLAAAGHPAMRFDLPSTGDSTGAPSDADRVDAWVAALIAAADRLRNESGAAAVAAIGLGLGGLLTREAIARGAAIDQLVLWGAPPRGRTFVREVKAFSRLQAWKPDAGEDLAAGDIEAGGFVLSADTQATLGGLEPPPGGALRRALLLGRDGVPVDTDLAESFRAGGVEVTTGPGEGWGVFVEHPEQTAFPQAVSRLVETWLEPTPPRAGTGFGASAGGEAILLLGDHGVLERPWHLDLDFGRAFGVLTEAASGSRKNGCAVFLNAGALRHTGPNRMWVEAARRFAGRGIDVLRLDLEGIGEADGRQTGLEGVDGFYEPRYEQQLRAVLDRLAAEGRSERFLCVGLCAGGFLAFRAALGDSRVKHAVLVNAGALAWRDGIVEDREARKLDRAFDRRWWRKLLTGQVAMRRLIGVLLSYLRSHLATLGRRGGTPPRADHASELDVLRGSGVRLTMAFSADEPLADELRTEGIFDQEARWPNLDLRTLPGEDHTLRSIEAQRALARLLDAEADRFLLRAADAPPGSQPSP
jgi:alpha-beta hydrolase superfamily lysophospholipase